VAKGALEHRKENTMNDATEMRDYHMSLISQWELGNRNDFYAELEQMSPEEAAILALRFAQVADGFEPANLLTFLTQKVG
jgi:hypothetical protein